jgi:hypothetical protein
MAFTRFSIYSIKLCGMALNKRQQQTFDESKQQLTILLELQYTTTKYMWAVVYFFYFIFFPLHIKLSFFVLVEKSIFKKRLLIGMKLRDQFQTQICISYQLRFRFFFHHKSLYSFYSLKMMMLCAWCWWWQYWCHLKY